MRARSHRRGLSLIHLAIFIASLATCLGQTLERVICPGEDVPGRPGETINSVRAYSIGANGHAVGELLFGNLSTRMVFRYEPGQPLQEVITMGDTIAGGTVTALNDALVSGSGKVLVSASVDFGGVSPVESVIAGNTVRKVIVVPGRLVNIVAN